MFEQLTTQGSRHVLPLNRPGFCRGSIV
jgi:hypothetical protein